MAELPTKVARLRVVRRFLSMANSFLENLSGALPIVEFVKTIQEDGRGLPEN